jgi:hypothetical protein
VGLTPEGAVLALRAVLAGGSMEVTRRHRLRGHSLHCPLKERHLIGLDSWVLIDVEMTVRVVAQFGARCPLGGPRGEVFPHWALLRGPRRLHLGRPARRLASTAPPAGG